MHTALNEQIRQDERSSLALTTMIFLSAAFCCMVPRATNIFLPLTALISLWTMRYGLTTHLPRTNWKGDPLLLATLALSAYMFASSGWSLDWAATLKQSIVVTFVFGAMWLGAVTMSKLETQPAIRAAYALLAGVAIGVSFLVFELLSDQAIGRTVHNLLPFLRPDSNKDFTLQAGRVIHIETFELNRNLALLSLMLWPAIYVAQSRLRGAVRFVTMAGLLGGTATAAALSIHETTQIALFSATCVFLASQLAPSAVRRIIIIFWCAGFVLAVPAAGFFYNTANLHKAEWLPLSARARIIIWGFTAENIPANPVLGIGVRSTRVLNRKLSPFAGWPSDHIIARTIGHHSHNIFLQSWLELGLAGVIIVMLGGVALFRRIASLPRSLHPAANAAAATFMIIASLAWGMWQSWLIAGYGLTVLLLVVAARAGEEHENRR